jgi:hypothetical protein
MLDAVLPSIRIANRLCMLRSWATLLLARVDCSTQLTSGSTGLPVVVAEGTATRYSCAAVCSATSDADSA